MSQMPIHLGADSGTDPGVREVADAMGQAMAAHSAIHEFNSRAVEVRSDSTQTDMNPGGD